MDQNTPEAWFRQMPKVTRAIATATFVVTVLVVLEMLDLGSMILDWRLIWGRLHLWRLFSDYFFIGKFSFGWVFQMYFLVTFSSKLEQNEIFSSSTPGSYLYFILLQMAALDVTSLLLYWPSGKYLMGPSLHFAIIYYWSKREPWAPVGLWGFSLQAYQLPFALLVLDVLMGGSVWGDLMGLFTGHMYYFLREILPHQQGIDLLAKCPTFLDTAMVKMQNLDLSAAYGRGAAPPPEAAMGGPRTARIHDFGVPAPGGPVRGAPAAGGGGVAEFSGRGHRLGGE